MAAADLCRSAATEPNAEPNEFVAFVLRETVVAQEIEGVVPLALNAEVEHAHVEVVTDVSEVVLWVWGHGDSNSLQSWFLDAEWRKAERLTRDGSPYL